MHMLPERPLPEGNKDDDVGEGAETREPGKGAEEEEHRAQIITRSGQR